MFFFTTTDPMFARVGWILALFFAVLAIVQLGYIALLTLLPTGERREKQPKEPIMPTKPNVNQTKAAIAPTGARMLVMAGIPGGGEIPMPSDKFIIGRYYHPESTILVALDERSISRRHVQFVGDPERREFYLTDMQSSYGTALQRPGNAGLLPLTPGTRMRIYNEDIVQFGQTVVIKFALPGEPRPFEAVATQATSNYYNIPARDR